MTGSEAQRPLVSIIVRTKDRPKLLRRALQSIAAQTYRPIEVVLVNDGGSELPEEALRKELGDIHLNYTHLAENRGRAHAGNIGIENSRGDYVGFLDDDDEFYPDHVSVLVNFLIRSDYKVAYTDARLIRRMYEPKKQVFEDIDEGVFLSEDFSYETLLFENYIPLTTLLFSREIFQGVGMFQNDLKIFEDWDLLIRVAGQFPFHHIPSVTTTYVQWSKDYQIASTDWRDARIGYLQILNSYSNNRTPATAYKYYLKKLEQLQRKDLVIRDLKSENRILQDIRAELNGAKEEIQRLREALRLAGDEIQSVGHDLQNRTDELDGTRNELKTVTADLKSAREEADVLMHTLHTARDEIQSKNAFIEEVRSGVGWRVLEYYRINIKNRLAPVGSNRWKIYNKMLKGLKSYKNHGLKTSADKVRRLIRETKATANIQKEDFIIPEIRETVVQPSATRVSVVIPTRNAGEDFPFLLDRIRRQRGLKDVELIIVDSGSGDETLAVAGRFGARIFSIKPSEFSHGSTRNLGAEHATGDYVIFLSQDAIPIGFTCFTEIVEGMKRDPRIAAVSARQIPRSDADLFACWQIWNHYENFLRYSDDRVVSVNGKEFDSLSPHDKRRVAQLDNVCSCVRRDIFDQYRFNDIPYAEDLDLGMRLIKDGYKIGFLSSVGVIHSHNRTPSYYFRRSAIDRKALIDFLGYSPIDWRSAGISSFSEMFRYVQRSYRKLDTAIHDLKSKGSGSIDISNLTGSLNDLLMSPRGDRETAGIDREMDSIIETLAASSSEGDIEVSVNHDVLREQFLSTLQSFSAFLSSHVSQKDRTEDIVSPLCKLYAVVIGANIGDYLAFQERGNGAARPEGLDQILGGGI